MSYTTLSGITVRDGQTEAEARAERDQYNLWCGLYGSPSYGGWALDPVDGVQKPLAEFKEKA